jgi:Arc/MetJ family transcription regulator
MRTNIDIDDELMAKAMAATGATTKKAVVEESLQLLVRLKAQEDIKQLRGKIVWRGHDDDWFASDEQILEKRRQAGTGSTSGEISTASGKQTSTAGRPQL